MRWLPSACRGLILVVAAVRSVLAGHPPEQFGPELPIVATLGCGPTMDVALEGNYLYAIGGARLYVARLDDPAKPRLVGELAGLGNVRQIAVREGIAYVTAREDGLFIVDVHRPEQPELLCHYDTIELATGICLSGPVAFVACRQNGVELIDVSDPRRPVHLSTLRPGEAQSVTCRDGLLYVGTWVSREVVICDVSDPRHPRVLSRAPMDGYADGQGWISTSSSRQAPAKASAAAPRHADVSPVGGIAVGDGYIYAAGAWSDLHVIQATGLAQRPAGEPGQPVVVPPATGYPVDPRCTVYDAGGQVYAVAPLGDGKAMVAAGSAGCQWVSLRPEPKRMAQIATQGFAMDVKVLGDHVYVAEGMGGLSIARNGGR